jgi:hypothetical protein
MPKTTISSSDLIWLFYERLKESTDCRGSRPSIAIVPSPGVGWTALMSPKQRVKLPLCAKRVEAIQKELRAVYVLKS